MDGRTSCSKSIALLPLELRKARNTFNTAGGDDANHHCSLARRSSGRSGVFEVFGFNKSKKGGSWCELQDKCTCRGCCKIRGEKGEMRFPTVGSSTINGKHLFLIAGGHACGFQDEGDFFSPHRSPLSHQVVPIRWRFLQSTLCQRRLPKQRTIGPRGLLLDKSYLIYKNNLLLAPKEKTVKEIIGPNYLYCLSA